MSGTVYTYAGYKLVEEREDYEYKIFRFAYVAYPTTYIERQTKRRSVHTMTWEATLQESVPEASEEYDHTQGYPGSVNPGNLSTSEGWRLYSVAYTDSLDQPLSRRVRETWMKTGAWEQVDTQDVPES
jgi:hypothetical protein